MYRKCGVYIRIKPLVISNSRSRSTSVECSVGEMREAGWRDICYDMEE